MNIQYKPSFEVGFCRSFERRIGKSLSTLQKNLLSHDLKKHLFTNELIKTIEMPIILEIGVGMGEHFVYQAAKNPNMFFIGVEVYLNGIANVLKLAIQHNITNFLLWPDDLDLIIHNLPNRILNGIYILFPDPWPKNKQRKKRIFNIQRLAIMQNKLKNGGFLAFASDIPDYFSSSLGLIKNNNNFSLLNEEDFSKPHSNYLMTKYHSKAINEGRTASFWQATYKC